MTYQTLDNLTSNGTSSDLVNIFTLPSINFPIFYPILLFAIFLIISLSLFFRQVEREGRSDIMANLATSSFVTSLIALSMSIFGIIGSTTTVYVFGVSIVFIVIYLLTDKK